MIVFVYQMGKVGSSTIAKSLEQSGFVPRELRQTNLDDPVIPENNCVVHTHDTHRLKQYLTTLRAAGGHRIVIISLVRDLLARNVSAFFNNFTKPENATWYVGSRADIRAASLDRLVGLFRERNARHMKKYVDFWPDTFLDATGFSLLELPFDTQRGASLYRHADGVQFLMLQTEKLTENWGMLQEVVSVPNLKTTMANVAAKKWYAGLYTAFKQHYRPSRIELEAHYEGFMRHFYSVEDLAKFRSQWTPQGVASGRPDVTFASDKLISPNLLFQL